MDDKTLTAIAISLACSHADTNQCANALSRTSYTPAVSIKEEFQQLMGEDVRTIGLETMQGLKEPIYAGIIQLEQGEIGNGCH